MPSAAGGAGGFVQPDPCTGQRPLRAGLVFNGDRQNHLRVYGALGFHLTGMAEGNGAGFAFGIRTQVKGCLLGKAVDIVVVAIAVHEANGITHFDRNRGHREPLVELVYFVLFSQSSIRQQHNDRTNDCARVKNHAVLFLQISSHHQPTEAAGRERVWMHLSWSCSTKIAREQGRLREAVAAVRHSDLANSALPKNSATLVLADGLSR